MDDVIRAAANATPAPAGIPLELAPLLSPYRRHAHLSLRIEQLPIRARFSKGSNNGDRTWSLTLDDLDGLAYLPPEGMVAPHKLAIRVISHEDDYGATVALLDLPITPGETRSVAASIPAALPSRSADGEDQAELRRLSDELTQLKTSLAAREAELAAARQAAEDARAEGTKQTKAELATARAAWEAELQDRLSAAAAGAASALEKSRAAWQAEQQDRVAASERHAQERIEQAYAHWHQASETALAKAEASWQAEEAARLAAAEAQWQERSEAALAEATARLDRAETALAELRARTEDDGNERRRLSDELAETKAALAAREAALEEARQSIEHIQAEASGQREAELAAARAAWEAELQAHLDAAASRERAQSEAALAEAAARQERMEAALAKARAQAESIAAEHHRSENELARATAALAAREAELAAARTAWEAELQDRLAAAAAEAASALEKSRAAWQVEQQDRFAASEGRLEEQIEQARLRWEEEAEAALAKIEDSWRAEEAKRLAAAEAHWREQSDAVLAKAMARLDRAETALAEACARIEDDEAELRRLKEELAEAKAALAARDMGSERRGSEQRGSEQGGSEQGEAQREPPPIEPARRAWSAEVEEAPRPSVNIGKLPQVQRLLAPRLEAQKDARSAPSEDRPAAALPAQGRSKIGLLAFCGAALATAAVAAMVYFGGVPAGFERWWPGAGTEIAESEPSPGTADTSFQRPSPVPAHSAARRIVIGASTANVRAGPSGTAAVIAALPQGTEVTPIERRGNWVLIRIVGGDGSRRNEGWVYASSLKEESGGS